MPIYSSDSDDARQPSRRFLSHDKSLHALLGGGKVADVVLWRDKNLSAAILVGFTVIWWLFEVMEYNFVTLACHISMFAMVILFIWSSGASLVNWSPPDPRSVIVPEATFRWLFDKINIATSKFYDVSSGNDLRTFILAIAFLWMLSGIGNYTSSLNLLYTGLLCLITIPVLYERYEDEVDYLARKGNRDVRKLYKKFDAKFLNKIPRGPVKEKKKF